MRDEENSNSSLMKWGVIGAVGAGVAFIAEGIAAGGLVSGETKKRPMNWKRSVGLGVGAAVLAGVGHELMTKAKQEKQHINQEYAERYWQDLVEEKSSDKSETRER